MVDVAIIVPKEDELRAVEQAFGTKFVESKGALRGGKLYYTFRQRLKTETGSSDVSVAVVFMNDQGNSIANDVANDVLSELDPPLIFLTGTAAGRPGKVNIGSVVASSLIMDAQEWRLEEAANPRIRHHEPPEKIRADVTRFIGQMPESDWRDKLFGVLEALYRQTEPPKELLTKPPEAHFGIIASSNYLIVNPQLLETLWKNDDRIRCIDMESGGFGLACKKSVQRQWLVVRGISDYGTPASKKDLYRVAAAASAAVFLQTFMEEGLRECQPNWLRPPESEKTELPEDSIYVKFDVITTFKQRIKDCLGIDLWRYDLGGSLNLADLESLCVAKGAERTKAHDTLSQIREDYFTTKYIDYTYENDLRGLIPRWANEIKEILAGFSVDLAASTVLDVGIGNGVEAPYLFADVGELIGVDISKRMLEKAKKLFPSMKTVQNPAEDLRDIKTGSVDVYISLRTYQSSLFDMPSALREAQRILKSKGIIIVSIANGFVIVEDSEKKIIRGLLVPGTRKVVDKSTPLQLGNQIYNRLNDLGFENVNLTAGKTDIYVSGQQL